MIKSNIKQKVYIVDDDVAVRDSLALLMKSINLECETFTSGQDFLDRLDPDGSGCLLLDIRMPNMSGLQLQNILLERHSKLPIIFLTGHASVPIAVQAMKKGAFEFIEKPFHDEELLGCVYRALKQDAEKQHEAKQQKAINERFKQLTPREIEVMKLIVKGESNKVVAHDLGVSQRTVEIYRANVMQKMRAQSLAHLVRMSLLIEDEHA